MELIRVQENSQFNFTQIIQEQWIFQQVISFSEDRQCLTGFFSQAPFRDEFFLNQKITLKDVKDLKENCENRIGAKLKVISKVITLVEGIYQRAEFLQETNQLQMKITSESTSIEEEIQNQIDQLLVIVENQEEIIDFRSFNTQRLVLQLVNLIICCDSLKLLGKTLLLISQIPRENLKNQRSRQDLYKILKYFLESHRSTFRNLSDYLVGSENKMTKINDKVRDFDNDFNGKITCDNLLKDWSQKNKGDNTPFCSIEGAKFAYEKTSGLKDNNKIPELGELLEDIKFFTSVFNAKIKFRRKGVREMIPFVILCCWQVVCTHFSEKHEFEFNHLLKDDILSLENLDLKQNTEFILLYLQYFQIPFHFINFEQLNLEGFGRLADLLYQVLDITSNQSLARGIVKILKVIYEFIAEILNKKDMLSENVLNYDCAIFLPRFVELYQEKLCYGGLLTRQDLFDVETIFELLSISPDYVEVLVENDKILPLTEESLNEIQQFFIKELSIENLKDLIELRSGQNQIWKSKFVRKIIEQKLDEDMLTDVFQKIEDQLKKRNFSNNYLVLLIFNLKIYNQPQKQEIQEERYIKLQSVAYRILTLMFNEGFLNDLDFNESQEDSEVEFLLNITIELNQDQDITLIKEVGDNLQHTLIYNLQYFLPLLSSMGFQKRLLDNGILKHMIEDEDDIKQRKSIDELKSNETFSLYDIIQKQSDGVLEGNLHFKHSQQNIILSKMKNFSESLSIIWRMEASKNVSRRMINELLPGINLGNVDDFNNLLELGKKLIHPMSFMVTEGKEARKKNGIEKVIVQELIKGEPYYVNIPISVLETLVTCVIQDSKNQVLKSGSWTDIFMKSYIDHFISEQSKLDKEEFSFQSSKLSSSSLFTSILDCSQQFVEIYNKGVGQVTNEIYFLKQISDELIGLRNQKFSLPPNFNIQSLEANKEFMDLTKSLRDTLKRVFKVEFTRLAEKYYEQFIRIDFLNENTKRLLKSSFIKRFNFMPFFNLVIQIVLNVSNFYVELHPGMAEILIQSILDELNEIMEDTSQNYLGTILKDTETENREQVQTVHEFIEAFKTNICIQSINHLIQNTLLTDFELCIQNSVFIRIAEHCNRIKERLTGTPSLRANSKQNINSSQAADDDRIITRISFMSGQIMKGFSQFWGKFMNETVNQEKKKGQKLIALIYTNLIIKEKDTEITPDTFINFLSQILRSNELNSINSQNLNMMNANLSGTGAQNSMKYKSPVQGGAGGLINQDENDFLKKKFQLYYETQLVLKKLKFVESGVIQNFQQTVIKLAESQNYQITSNPEILQKVVLLLTPLQSIYPVEVTNIIVMFDIVRPTISFIKESVLENQLIRNTDEEALREFHYHINETHFGTIFEDHTMFKMSMNSLFIGDDKYYRLLSCLSHYKNKITQFYIKFNEKKDALEKDLKLTEMIERIQNFYLFFRKITNKICVNLLEEMYITKQSFGEPNDFFMQIFDNIERESKNQFIVYSQNLSLNTRSLVNLIDLYTKTIFESPILFHRENDQGVILKCFLNLLNGMKEQIPNLLENDIFLQKFFEITSVSFSQDTYNLIIKNSGNLTLDKIKDTLFQMALILIDLSLSQQIKRANLEKHLLNFLYDPVQKAFRTRVTLQEFVIHFEDLMYEQDFYYLVANVFRAQVYHFEEVMNNQPEYFKVDFNQYNAQEMDEFEIKKLSNEMKSELQPLIKKIQDSINQLQQCKTATTSRITQTDIKNNQKHLQIFKQDCKQSLEHLLSYEVEFDQINAQIEHFNAKIHNSIIDDANSDAFNSSTRQTEENFKQMESAQAFLLQVQNKIIKKRFNLDEVLIQFSQVCQEITRIEQHVREGFRRAGSREMPFNNRRIIQETHFIDSDDDISFGINRIEDEDTIPPIFGSRFSIIRRSGNGDEPQLIAGRRRRTHNLNSGLLYQNPILEDSINVPDETERELNRTVRFREHPRRVVQEMKLPEGAPEGASKSAKGYQYINFGEFLVQGLKLDPFFPLKNQSSVTEVKKRHQDIDLVVENLPVINGKLDFSTDGSQRVQNLLLFCLNQLTNNEFEPRDTKNFNQNTLPVVWYSVRMFQIDIFEKILIMVVKKYPLLTQYLLDAQKSEQLIQTIILKQIKLNPIHNSLLSVLIHRNRGFYQINDNQKILDDKLKSESNYLPLNFSFINYLMVQIIDMVKKFSAEPDRLPLNLISCNYWIMYLIQYFEQIIKRSHFKIALKVYEQLLERKINSVHAADDFYKNGSILVLKKLLQLQCQGQAASGSQLDSYLDQEVFMRFEEELRYQMFTLIQFEQDDESSIVQIDQNSQGQQQWKIPVDNNEEIIHQNPKVENFLRVKTEYRDKLQGEFSISNFPFLEEIYNISSKSELPDNSNNNTNEKDMRKFFELLVNQFDTNIISQESENQQRKVNKNEKEIISSEIMDSVGKNTGLLLEEQIQSQAGQIFQMQKEEPLMDIPKKRGNEFKVSSDQVPQIELKEQIIQTFFLLDLKYEENFLSKFLEKIQPECTQTFVDAFSNICLLEINREQNEASGGDLEKSNARLGESINSYVKSNLFKNWLQPIFKEVSELNYIEQIFYCFKGMNILLLKLNNDFQKEIDFFTFRDFAQIDRKSLCKSIQGTFIAKHKIFLIDFIFTMKQKITNLLEVPSICINLNEIITDVSGLKEFFLMGVSSCHEQIFKILDELKKRMARMSEYARETDVKKVKMLVMSQGGHEKEESQSSVSRSPTQLMMGNNYVATDSLSGFNNSSPIKGNERNAGIFQIILENEKLPFEYLCSIINNVERLIINILKTQSDEEKNIQLFFDQIHKTYLSEGTGLLISITETIVNQINEFKRSKNNLEWAQIQLKNDIDFCPNQHPLAKFSEGDQEAYNRRCDVCRTSIRVPEMYTYQCKQCDFDRCNICYDKEAKSINSEIMSSFERPVQMIFLLQQLFYEKREEILFEIRKLRDADVLLENPNRESSVISSSSSSPQKRNQNGRSKSFMQFYREIEQNCKEFLNSFCLHEDVKFWGIYQYNSINKIENFLAQAHRLSTRNEGSHHGRGPHGSANNEEPSYARFLENDDNGFLGFLREHRNLTDFLNRRSHSGGSGGGLSKEFFIDRTEIWKSTVQALSEDLQGCTQFKVKFKGEQGVDHGGLLQDWITCIAREFFIKGLLVQNQKFTCSFPNPAKNTEAFQYDYITIGKIIGICILQKLTIGIDLATCFIQILMKRQIYFNDMLEYDDELFNQLKWTLENNVSNLEVEFDHPITQEQTMLTQENQREYVSLVCKSQMVQKLSQQTEYIITGLHELINQKVIIRNDDQTVFSFLKGTRIVPVDDFKKKMKYSGYDESQPMIIWFWEIFGTWTNEMRLSFIYFVTGLIIFPCKLGSYGLPWDGFKRINITLERIGDPQLLPISHTCSFKLELPEYPNKETLRQKLEIAVLEGAGRFEIM